MKNNKVSKWIIGMFVLVSVVLFSSPAFAASQFWDASSGDWAVGSNWASGSKPASGDYAYIRNNSTSTVTTVETVEVLSLGSSSGAGCCILNSGSLTVSSSLKLGNTGSGIYILNGGNMSLYNVYIPYYGHTTGSFTQNGGTNEISGSQFWIPRTIGGNGIYTLNAGKLSSGNLIFGCYGGTGTFTQVGGIYTNSGSITFAYSANTLGTYNLTNGILTTKAQTIGRKGIGVFNQSGGTNFVSGTLTVSSYSGSRGTYSMSGGILDVVGSEHYFYIGGTVGATGTFVQAGGTVSSMSLDVGHNGSHGTYMLGGDAELELADSEYIRSDGTFIQTGGVHNIGDSLHISSNGVFRGWGDINANSTKHLYMSGIIIADGYGDVDRTLAITNYDRLFRDCTNPADGTNGYYAVHHGKLTLKSFPTDGSYQFWGEYGSHGLINNVKFTDFSMSDSGVLSGSLYAPDHSEVPKYETNAKIAGIWGFDDSSDSVVGTADIRFRYDHVAVSNLGLDETTMKVFHHSGGIDDKWEEITDLTRDTAAKTITLNDVNPVGFFAIGVEISAGRQGPVITTM